MTSAFGAASKDVTLQTLAEALKSTTPGVLVLRLAHNMAMADVDSTVAAVAAATATHADAAVIVAGAAAEAATAPLAARATVRRGPAVAGGMCLGIVLRVFFAPHARTPSSWCFGGIPQPRRSIPTSTAAR